MSTKASKLKEFIRHLIRQELKELEEVSVTGTLDGGEGPPRTPYAFYGGRKKDKEKKKRIAQAGGYMKVKESVNETPQMAKQGQVGLLLKLANKQLQNVFSLHKKGKNKEAKAVFNNKVYSTLEYIHRAFDNVSESINEQYGLSFGDFFDYATKDREKVDFLKKIKKSKPKVFQVLKAKDKEAQKILNKYSKMFSESVTEGKYHQYRNDETMTPKQKIGRSMREIRDSLNELDKLVKMNVRLKNELNVDSRSYWKNTHKALGKISERLVKLANKVGQLK